MLAPNLPTVVCSPAQHIRQRGFTILLLESFRVVRCYFAIQVTTAHKASRCQARWKRFQMACLAVRQDTANFTRPLTVIYHWSTFIYILVWRCVIRERKHLQKDKLENARHKRPTEKRRHLKGVASSQVFFFSLPTTRRCCSRRLEVSSSPRFRPVPRPTVCPPEL